MYHLVIQHSHGKSTIHGAFHGNIIQKWAMASMAMLVITRGYNQLEMILGFRWIPATMSHSNLAILKRGGQDVAMVLIVSNMLELSISIWLVVSTNLKNVSQLG